MSTPEFKKILLNRMHLILKPLGFRKNGSTFSAETNDVVLFIQLQSSRKTTSVELVATVNLGVFSHTIATREGNTRKPNIWEAQWRMRIGFLMTIPRDKWWEISSEREATKAGDEIAKIIELRALPLLSTISSTTDLKRLWETGRSPGLTEYQRKEFLQLLNDAGRAITA